MKTSLPANNALGNSTMFLVRATECGMGAERIARDEYRRLYLVHMPTSRA